MKKTLLRSLCAITVLLLGGWAAFAQNSIILSGVVLDSQTQEPVPGAVIMQSGKTSAAAITDIDGKYSISVDPKSTVVCTCLGYKESMVQVNGRARIDFSLETDTQMLEETVVVGYGTLKKSQLVGSVESVSGEVLEDRVTSDVTRSLQGQIPGLNIIQTDGKPSHGGQIYIRGGATSYATKSSFSSYEKSTQSIGQGGSALILIDGVEGDLSSVNPEDVESVSVLKDASSSVIYGARAAYGVILVTTKNSNSEKITISYNGSASLNSRLIKWEDNIIDDGEEFMKTFTQFFSGYSQLPGADGKIPDAVNTYKNLPEDYIEQYQARREAGNTNVYGHNGKYYLYFGNYNYLEMFYKPSNMTQTHNISISGKTGRTSYSVSGRYYTQDGIYKIGNENYNSFNVRAKVSVKANDWLSFDNNVTLYRMNYTQPIFSKRMSTVGNQLWQIAVQGQPMIPPVNEDGTYTVGAAASGYAAFADGNSFQDDNKFIVSNTTGITIEPLPGVLKFRGDFTYKTNRRGIDRQVAPVSYSTAEGSVTDYVSQADSYKIWRDYNTDHLTANAVLTWTPKLGENHNLNVVGGWNLEDYQYRYRAVTRQGMLYPGQNSFELYSGTEIGIADYDRSYGLVGVFGRINYTLLSRYIVELSARYDGSSKFPSNQKWGFFPSASFGWRLSEEPFMEDTKDWLSNLKLRANAGTLGNGTIAPYSYLSTMGIEKSGVIFDGESGYYVSNPGITPDNLTWEKVTTYDVGLDMDVLKSKLSFSADYYIRNTTDLFIKGPELPATLGTSSPKGNYGALQTKGWELTISWKDSFKLAGKDFVYSVKGSVWDSRTWVTKYYSTTNNIFQFYEGKELGELWGFKTDGYWLSNEEAANWGVEDTFHTYGSSSTIPFAGDLKFVDTNDDQKISVGSYTLDDHGDIERIGNTTPRYQFGLNLDFKWNNIGLSMFFQGVCKRDWYPDSGSGFFWGGYARAYDFAIKTQGGDNYTHINTDTENWYVENASSNPYWTRRYYNAAQLNVGTMTSPNTYYLLNAAYLRLKNLTVDYTFPKKWAEKISADKLRCYLSCENLFTLSPIYKYTKMFDPEVISLGDSDFQDGTERYMGDGYSYPMLRTVTFGVNITF